MREVILPSTRSVHHSNAQRSGPLGLLVEHPELHRIGEEVKALQLNAAESVDETLDRVAQLLAQTSSVRPGSSVGEAVPSSAKLLTSNQAAQYLQVSRRTLDRLRARRIKLGALKIGGQVRYNREALDEFLRKKTNK